MHDMENLKAMLTDELDKFAQKSELTTGSLDAIHKLTDTIKNICKIKMLSEAEEEGASSYRRGQRRDSMGRYARDSYREAYRDGGGSSRDNGSYRDGRGRSSYYSRAEAKESIMEQIEDLMTDASEQEKQVLRRAMQSLENA